MLATLLKITFGESRLPYITCTVIKTEQDDSWPLFAGFEPKTSKIGYSENESCTLGPSVATVYEKVKEQTIWNFFKFKGSYFILLL